MEHVSAGRPHLFGDTCSSEVIDANCRVPLRKLCVLRVQPTQSPSSPVTRPPLSLPSAARPTARHYDVQKLHIPASFPACGSDTRRSHSPCRPPRHVPRSVSPPGSRPPTLGVNVSPVWTQEARLCVPPPACFTLDRVGRVQTDPRPTPVFSVWRRPLPG